VPNWLVLQALKSKAMGKGRQEPPLLALLCCCPGWAAARADPCRLHWPRGHWVWSWWGRCSSGTATPSRTGASLLERFLVMSWASPHSPSLCACSGHSAGSNGDLFVGLVICQQVREYSVASWVPCAVLCNFPNSLYSN